MRKKAYGILISIIIIVGLTACAGQSTPPASPTAPARLTEAVMVTAEATTPSPTAQKVTPSPTVQVVTPSVTEPVGTSAPPVEYVAFSLNAAQEMMAGAAAGQDYRTVYPEVYNLGGITQIVGLVYDRQAKDLILVGQRNLDRQPLTLDDFAVALRARFVHSQWPLVSIDPTEDTPQTGLQTVRFEGGVQNTQFGKDLSYMLVM